MSPDAAHVRLRECRILRRCRGHCVILGPPPRPAGAVYPVAASLFRTADIPKRLMPAAIALGAFTFTMTALPGTPAIQNAIPMPFFGTTLRRPGLGLITGTVMLGFGLVTRMVGPPGSPTRRRLQRDRRRRPVHGRRGRPVFTLVVLIVLGTKL
jgi:hypothetical protein